MLPSVCESLDLLVSSGLHPEMIAKIRGRDTLRAPAGWRIVTEEGEFSLSGPFATAVRVLQSWSRPGPDQPLMSLVQGGTKPAPAEWVHAILEVSDACRAQGVPSPAMVVLSRMGAFFDWLCTHPESLADPIFAGDGSSPAEVAGRALWRVTQGQAVFDARYHQARAETGSGLLLLVEKKNPAEVVTILRWLDVRPRSAVELWHYLLRRPGLLRQWEVFYEQIVEADHPDLRHVVDQIPQLDPHARSREVCGAPPEVPLLWDQILQEWAQFVGAKDAYAFLVQGAVGLPRPWAGSDLADYYEALSPLYRGRVFRSRWNRFRSWLQRTWGVTLAAPPGSRKGDASAMSLPLDVAQAVVALAGRVPASQISRARWSDVTCDESRVPGDRMRWELEPGRPVLGVELEEALAVLRRWAFARGRLPEQEDALILPIRPGSPVAVTSAAIRFLAREARKGQLAVALRCPIRAVVGA